MDDYVSGDVMSLLLKKYGIMNKIIDEPWHIFPSAFFLKLEVEGMEYIKSRMVCCDHFLLLIGKKFVFIPICRSMHWLLVVLVNPGDLLKDGKISHTGEISCMLVFDTLSKHSTDQKNAESRYGFYAALIRDWLNSYAKDSERPFTPTSFPIFQPKVPHKENGIDCGLFVYHYVQEMTKLASLCFTKFEIECNFQNIIQFQFDQSIVTRFLWDTISLLQVLGDEYIRLHSMG